MAGQDIEYTGLTIKISADSQDANKSIASIRKGLVALDETAKNLDQKQIKEVEKILRDIAKIDFSNVSKGLQSVVTAFKQLNSISGKQGGGRKGKTLSGDKQPNISNMSPIDLRSNIPAFSTKGFDGSAFNDTIAKAKELNTTFKISKQVLKDAKKSFKNLSTSVKEGSTALGKWLKRAREIAKYRIIRKAIQEVYKALVTGIQQVALFDDATNKAMSNIKSSATYFVNSIGAMLSPLIQMFEPFLTSLNQAFAEAGNTFAEFFAVMNGQDTFAKAKEDLIDYRNTLKSTTTGIDELNVLSKQDGFEVAQVDMVKEGMSDIKGLFTDVVAMVKDLVELAKPFITDVVSHIAKILKPVVNIITNIVSLIKTLVGSTFVEVNNSLYSFMDMVANILDFVAEIVNGLMPQLVAMTQVIAPVLNFINGVLGIIFDTVGGIFHVLVPIVRFVNILNTPLNYILTIVSTIFYALEGIFRMFKNIFSFNFSNIASDWQDVGKKIANAWNLVNEQTRLSVTADLSGYATGGFPEDGLFFANSTELVGRFDDGRTAVANNEQITQGIYQAVLQAMRESGGSEVVVNLDGYELAKVVTERQGNFGTNLVKGGKLRFGD